MTNDINNYEFDFEAEVEALRRALGTRADNLLFLDVAVGGTEEDPNVDLRQAIGNKDIHGQNSLMTAEQRVAWFYLNNPYESSQTLHFYQGDRSGPLLGQAVALREKEYHSQRLGEENRELFRLWILYHETAHTLMPDFPDAANDNPLIESTADAYAALQFLQRFGEDAANFISRISWCRAHEAFLGDSSHLTTVVLDKIIADSRHVDFSTLSFEETVERAEAYAREWTPSPETLTAANDIMQQGKAVALDRIARTCLSSSNAFAFYIGAKFFQPFLQPQGVIFDGDPLIIPEGARERHAGEIAERGHGMTLRDVFGKQSAKTVTDPGPSVSEALKVAEPPRRRPFIVNRRFSMG